MFLLQLFTRDLLACNRVFRAVFSKQRGGLDRDFWARTCDLDICDSRDDFTGGCLLYAERYVLIRSLDEMRELVEEPGDVRDSKMVLRP